MKAEILVLRLVHILGGMFWVGSGLFTSLFLVPVLSSSGPTMGQVMGGLQRRKMFTVLPIVALVTIASGLRLMWIGSGGFDASYFATRFGFTLALSGAAAVLAFALSVIVARPAAVRAGQLAPTLATAPDPAARATIEAELARLRRRGAVASVLALGLLLFGAAGMAVARYL